MLNTCYICGSRSRDSLGLRLRDGQSPHLVEKHTIASQPQPSGVLSALSLFLSLFPFFLRSSVALPPSRLSGDRLGLCSFPQRERLELVGFGAEEDGALVEALEASERGARPLRHPGRLSAGSQESGSQLLGHLGAEEERVVSTDPKAFGSLESEVWDGFGTASRGCPWMSGSAEHPIASHGWAGCHVFPCHRPWRRRRLRRCHLLWQRRLP